jgi:hypothetical protein
MFRIQADAGRGCHNPDTEGTGILSLRWYADDDTHSAQLFCQPEPTGLIMLTFGMLRGDGRFIAAIRRLQYIIDARSGYHPRARHSQQSSGLDILWSAGTNGRLDARICPAQFASARIACDAKDDSSCEDALTIVNAGIAALDRIAFQATFGAASVHRVIATGTRLHLSEFRRQYGGA